MLNLLCRSTSCHYKTSTARTSTDFSQLSAFVPLKVERRVTSAGNRVSSLTCMEHCHKCMVMVIMVVQVYKHLFTRPLTAVCLHAPKTSLGHSWPVWLHSTMRELERWEVISCTGRVHLTCANFTSCVTQHAYSSLVRLLPSGLQRSYRSLRPLFSPSSPMPRQTTSP